MNTRAKSILLVDDDLVVLKTLEPGLVETGYEVTACSTAVSALTAFTAQPPDLAVVDIDLPDMQGTKLAAQFLRIRYTPILILSNHNDTTRVSEAIGSGVFGYLVKPLAARQLVPSIETALVRFREINQRAAERFGYADLTSVIDQLSFGIIIIDDRHRIIQCNRLAQDLLDERILSTDVCGKLRSCTQAKNFENMLDTAVGNDAPSAAGVVTVHHTANTKSIQVWGSPLPTSESSQGNAAILVAIDPDQTAIAHPALLKALYGLTAKESELLQALLDGETIEAYSQRTFVSPNTVRTHLKSIYRKTQTNRQVDLVRLFSRLFANIPAKTV